MKLCSLPIIFSKDKHVIKALNDAALLDFIHSCVDDVRKGQLLKDDNDA